MEHFGVWETQRVELALNETFDGPGELPARGFVNALQEPPVPGGGQRNVVVVREPVGPVTGHDPRREVFIDNDHGQGACSVVVVVAGQRRVRVGDLVEGPAELFSKVAGGESPHDGPALVGETGVASSAARSAFLEKLISDGHDHQYARPAPLYLQVGISPLGGHGL